jgi:hypothetical protein
LNNEDVELLEAEDLVVTEVVAAAEAVASEVEVEEEASTWAHQLLLLNVLRSKRPSKV